MAKRISTFFLAVVLAVGLLPLPAMAEEAAARPEIRLEPGTYVEHEAIAYVVDGGARARAFSLSGDLIDNAQTLMEVDADAAEEALGDEVGAGETAPAGRLHAVARRRPRRDRWAPRAGARRVQDDRGADRRAAGGRSRRVRQATVTSSRSTLSRTGVWRTASTQTRATRAARWIPAMRGCRPRGRRRRGRRGCCSRRGGRRDRGRRRVRRQRERCSFR